MAKPRNDRNQAVTKFCLTMEEHRRTEAGRVRTAREFVMSFFPHDDSGAQDKVFCAMPNEVRGPILSTWGIRGTKAALKDDDQKVSDVVYDALIAGDIDEGIFEDGVTAQVLVDWIALPDWWSFWRHGKLTGVAIQKALGTARELGLIDDRWFFANIQGRSGRLKGTDVVCDTLSKDQIVAWVRKLHESGDGSPAGLVSALGWEVILAKTAQDALLFALDAFAKKAGLVVEPPPAEPATPKVEATKVEATKVEATKDTAKKEEPIPASVAAAQEARTDPPAASLPESGIPVAVPEIPPIDGADATDNTSNGQSPWSGTEESPQLVEARAKMMEILGEPKSDAPPPDDWSESAVDKALGEWTESTESPAGASDQQKPGAPPPLPKKPAVPTSGR